MTGIEWMKNKRSESRINDENEGLNVGDVG